MDRLHDDPADESTWFTHYEYDERKIVNSQKTVGGVIMIIFTTSNIVIYL